MATALTKLLNIIIRPPRDPEPLDKVQLEAAQDRLYTRSLELDESVDELSKMIKRMRRRQDRRKQ